MPYDFTLRLPERMTLPTPWEIEDAMKTLSRMGMRVVRKLDTQRIEHADVA